MGDVEDDSQIDDDEWEDMELEDDMETKIYIYIHFLHIKKYKTHTIPQAKSIGSGSSTYLKMIWVEMHHLVHLLLSLVIMNSKTSTE